MNNEGPINIDWFVQFSTDGGQTWTHWLYLALKLETAIAKLKTAQIVDPGLHDGEVRQYRVLNRWTGEAIPGEALLDG